MTSYCWKGALVCFDGRESVPVEVGEEFGRDNVEDNLSAASFCSR